MNGALHTHGGRALFEGDSIESAAGSILSDVANAATTNPATVFSSFLKGIVSEAQDFSSFNKSQLANLKLGPFGALNVNDPVLTALSQLSKDKPDSILSAEQTITNLLEEFCDPATCSSSSDPSDPTSSSCTAKSATLALEPWSCVLNSNETALECTPAVLVLQKTPGRPLFEYNNSMAGRSSAFAILL
ncbi:hypothetical protein WJX73_010512 [Symbiochloris irregularis]|uniref:Uncharacterized protein n=1 Tax=Symbiochloris irregularis TaxID=706552 RepID=A0AAW1NR72_9CHLO